MSEPGRSGEQLEVHLLATAGMVRRAYDLRLAALGLNITESGLLQYLSYEQPLTQSDLAQRLHIGRMAAGSVVKDLLGRGLLVRARDPQDARAWSVSLTPAGEQLASACAEVDDQVVRGLRAGLSRDDQRNLHRLLGTVRTNAQRVVDARSSSDHHSSRTS